MKKIITIISALAVCAMLTACDTAPESGKVNRFEGLELLVPAEVDRIVDFTDLESLEEACELIVVGTFADDPVQEEFYGEPATKKFLYNILSMCPVKVSKVFKGDLSVGDTVNVLQCYGIVDDKLIMYDMLPPMQKGDEWLFFLHKHEEKDAYWCWGDTDARYPTSNSVNNAPVPFTDAPELIENGYAKYDKRIYKEIVEKYDI